LRDLGLKLSSLDDAESLDREDDYAGLAEPITMVRRHAEEAFAGLSMLEPQILEES
jgi:carbonic anhydrase